MRKRARIFIVIVTLGLFGLSTAAQEKIDTVIVDVNMDMRHTVAGVSMFDREKFITIHADVTEQEWEGDNFTPDLRDHFLNGYDVYMGRNTGGISWNINNIIGEDPSRIGYANPADIQNYGQNTRNNYASKTAYHAYENRNSQVIAAQLHPFWPDGKQTNKGWAFSQEDSEEVPFGSATGEYMGKFIKEYYGTGGLTGQNRPNLVEVINEPLWHLVDYGSEQPDKIFRFHNSVAHEIRKYNDNIQIGGYCTAFPDHEKNNFQEWETRWKAFMDIAGANMDFWSIHLYDFPSINNGKQRYRKGAQMEATFDMMEHYSYLSFGKAKPFLITEFGAQMHDYNKVWSPYRDWLHVKSTNSMLMQFMERPNLISKAITFIPIKAEWGYDNTKNIAYNHRLMRRENEPQSYTGKWIYTEMVQFYQLWSEVKGLRVDTKTTNLDIMSDAYVDGNTVHVIINNLDFVPHQLKIKTFGNSNPLQSLKIRQLYLLSKQPVLEEETLNSLPESIILHPEATIILTYKYAQNVDVNEQSEEVKYYATDYFKPIVANTSNYFNINDVATGTYGEAILRLGIGRAHGKSLNPAVTFNGVKIKIPGVHRGDDQHDRASFFGVLEIPVPYNLLKSQNQIDVKFDDDGGYISSVALQAFEFSRKMVRSEKPEQTAILPLPVSKFRLTPNPANGFFVLTSLTVDRASLLEIFDLHGRLMFFKQLFDKQERVDVSMLPKGMYFVKIKTGMNNYIDKILIQ